MKNKKNLWGIMDDNWYYIHFIDLIKYKHTNGNASQNHSLQNTNIQAITNEDIKNKIQFNKLDPVCVAIIDSIFINFIYRKANSYL